MNQPINDDISRSKTIFRCPGCLREQYEQYEPDGPWVPKEQSRRGPFQPIIWLPCSDCKKIRETQTKYQSTKLNATII